jgi:ABC-2 type transport system ATP-binding protein
MSLEVHRLMKKFGDKTVVDDLSFTMPKPGVYALLGTNGAGKTTSLRMILGILSKDSGSVLWKGKPLEVSECNVGYLAEERGLYPKYTLMDQLIYFAELRGVSRAEARRRIKEWSDKLDLGEYLYPQKSVAKKGFAFGRGGGGTGTVKLPSKKAEQLSKGNQQKIQFMAALISDPELIVLDEPMSGLDPVNTDLFKSVINEQIERGKYLIMSSHQMATVEEFCTDITILHRSKTVLQGNLNEIKRGYGRINLSLKAEGDISACIARSGARIVHKKENEYMIKVTGEEQANALLGALIEEKATIIRFDLREPSLHEIFVGKVGDAADE